MIKAESEIGYGTEDVKENQKEKAILTTSESSDHLVMIWIKY